jgi:hypothetical protein
MTMRYTKSSLLRLAASFTLMGVPFAVLGQEQPASKEQPAPKESETNSRYITEQPAGSGVAVQLHSESSWDDNILGNNAHRIRDYVFEEGGLLRLWTNHPEWKLGLEYQPNALLYRTVNSLNQLDHRINFDNEFHAARHVLFRLRDSLDYATGVLAPQANPDISLPVGGPSNLNTTLFTPFARQFANEASGEAEYDMSLRNSLHISGSHGLRRFSNVGNFNSTAGLFNTQSDVGGASYGYRVTRHFTASLEYQYQEYRFGQTSHDKTHGAFMKVLWDVRPHITLSVFGGPEYSDSEGQFSTPSTNPLQPGNVTTTQRTKQWNPGGGGSVTLRSDRTVLRLTAQRLVGDGGGLLAAVTNSYEGAEIRRQVTGRLDVALTASNARTVALQGPSGKGAVDTQAAGVAVEYPLLQNLSMHLGYNYLRQRANQFVPVAPDLDRNRFTLGLFFRAHDYKF